MFQNCGKDGDCYVGIRSVRITIYLLHSQFQCTYFLHCQFQYNYYTVNSYILIILTAQSIPIYLLHSQFLFTYLLHSQFQSCPFLLAICWAFVIIIVNSLCVAFCYKRFVQGCGILLLLTFTFSKTFKK